MMAARPAGQRVEAVSAATDTVNDYCHPLDFSYMQLTCLEDADKEDPRKPVPAKNEEGKYEGRSLRMYNNKILDISSIKAYLDKTFVNPSMIAWLDLSYNSLTTISPVAELTSLQILYLHGNNITNLKEVDHLTSLTNLSKLMLHGNEIDKTKGYRMYVLSKMPWVKNFDCSAVTKCEARTAQDWSKMNNPNKKKKKIQSEDWNY